METLMKWCSNFQNETNILSLSLKLEENFDLSFLKIKNNFSSKGRETYGFQNSAMLLMRRIWPSAIKFRCDL